MYLGCTWGMACRFHLLSGSDICLVILPGFIGVFGVGRESFEIDPSPLNVCLLASLSWMAWWSPVEINNRLRFFSTALSHGFTNVSPYFAFWHSLLWSDVVVVRFPFLS